MRPLILPGDINIEVTKPDVEGKRWHRPPGRCGRQRAQEARPWHEGRLTEDMLRGGPRKGHAVAGRRSQGQGQAKPAEEQHTEERRSGTQARPVWW